MIAKIKEWVASAKNFFSDAESEASVLSSQHLQTLLTMSQTMTALRDLDEVLAFLLSEIRQQFDLNCGVLMIEDDKVFRVRCHRGFSAALVSQFEIPFTEGTLNECFSFGRKIILGEDKISQRTDMNLLLKNENWKSVFLAPLSIQNQAQGIFIAGSMEASIFDEKKVQALDPFIQIVALGIRNAQLLEKMEKFNRRLEAEVNSTTQELTRTNNRLIHRVRELKALYEITLSAGKSGSLEEIFKTVMSRLQELFDAKYMGFFINVSSKGNFIDLVSQNPSFGLAPELHHRFRINSSNFSEGGTVTRLIFESYNTGEIKMFQGNAIAMDQELPKNIGAAFAEEFETIVFDSFVAVPLKTSQKSLGVMVLMNPLKEQRALSPDIAPAQVLSEEELRTLTLVASRIASSIESFQLDMEIKGRLTDLSALQEISETFYAAPILEFDLGKIVKIIVKSLGCDSCVFMFFDPSSSQLVASASTENAAPAGNVKDARHLALDVFQEGKSRILDDMESEGFHSETERDAHSMILVPMKIEKETIGVLKLGSRQKSFFNQHHLRLSELIADRAAVLVQNTRLYEKIWHANQELERLNQVKTEFVSIVSHELRTPMTAIKGFVDIVLSEEAGPLAPQQKKFLRIAHNSIDRLTMLISDLLDLSRIESGKMKMDLFATRMEKILQESAETYHTTILSKKMQFSLEMDKKLPEILADEARIKQVIDNLLSNAMKFTPEGGQIKISAGDMGDYILVAVSDTGPGIKKEDQEKIFEKFYQVDSSLTRQIGGTGLGLAICKSIIEMHGGRIWVESEPGKGSTFRFLMPRLRHNPLTEEIIQPDKDAPRQMEKPVAERIPNKK